MTDQDHEMSAPVDEAAPRMEVDATGGSESNRNKPHFGTTRYFNNIEPTVPSSKTMSELFEEYKTFSLLKKKDEMASNQEAGDSAYLISSEWFNNYLKYILYEAFKDN